MSSDDTPRHGSSSRVGLLREIALEYHRNFTGLAADPRRPPAVRKRAEELAAECTSLATTLESWPANPPSNDERNTVTNRTIVMARLFGELSCAR